ncbi:MAG: protein kinase domain-containing protein [Rubripirellula sp.]
MIASTSDIESSRSSFDVADLTSEQQQRLTQILDDYLRGLEEGEPIDVPKTLQANADLADVLRVYLSKLDGLHDIAAGFQSHGELEPLVSGESNSAVQSLRLGDFTILREIGRGGMGIVYEATQNTLNRRVALKLLPLASMLDGRQIARFKNESHAAAQLQHPNIVPIFSVGIERGIHYYAMQYIEGLTVEQWIEAEFDIKSETQWQASVRTAAAVADALQCAHECGIVHRDVKPSNLMLDESGKAWVTDFGLARCQNDHSLTLSGDIVGTMRYMSPEQAAGRTELVDHRTDIYSLGATLYEMLVGVSAVEGEDGPSVLSAIVNSPAPHVRRKRPHLPTDVDVVLQRAMSKDKDDRYATASEFAEDLRAVLEHRPTIAKPPSPFVLAKRWSSRHRRVMAASSLVFVMGVIGLLASVIVISQKNVELKASNQLADKSFKNAQEAVGRLGSAVSAQLASIPGAEHVRQSVLNDTLSYYQQFVEDASEDPRLRSELALTHSRIGSLVRELESAQESVPHFLKSDQAYRRLLDDEPDSASFAAGMARNLNQLGLACVDAGDIEQAESAYQQAIDLQRKTCVKDNGSENQTELALTRSNLGLLLRSTGRLDEAQTQLSLAVETLSRTAKLDPNSVLSTRGLAAALANLSSLSVEEDPQRSINLLEQALDHQLSISQSAPSQIKASSEVAATYNALGSAQLANDDPSKAEEAFTTSVRIYRRLHAIAPAVDGYRFDLAMSLTNASTALYQQQRYAEALTAAREAIDLQSSKEEWEDLTDSIALSRLGVMHSNLATSLEATGESLQSMKEMQSAIKCQALAIEFDPSMEGARSFLMQHMSSLLRIQIKQQRWREANQTVQEFRAAALEQPSQLIPAATALAELSMLTTEGRFHDQLADSSIALLASARDAGIQVDQSLLDSAPFATFSQHPKFRRVVQP